MPALEAERRLIYEPALPVRAPALYLFLSHSLATVKAKAIAAWPHRLRLEMQPGVRLYNFTGYFDASSSLSLIMQPDGLRLINNVLHSLLPVRWSVINQRLLCKRNAVPPGNGSAPQYATRAATTTTTSEKIATRSVEITSHVMPSQRRTDSWTNLHI